MVGNPISRSRGRSRLSSVSNVPQLGGLGRQRNGPHRPDRVRRGGENDLKRAAYVGHVSDERRVDAVERLMPTRRTPCSATPDTTPSCACHRRTHSWRRSPPGDQKRARPNRIVRFRPRLRVVATMPLQAAAQRAAARREVIRRGWRQSRSLAPAALARAATSVEEGSLTRSALLRRCGRQRSR